MMSVKYIYPHYVVREDNDVCECHHDDVCDCMPSLLLTKNSSTGYGLATWTYSDETCPSEISHFGKAYWCEFLGLPGFWATGESNAADILREKLDSMGMAASVQYVDNREATKTKAYLK